MLVFGGMRDDPLADVWRYSPYTNTWLQLLPDGEHPPTQFDHSAVWDSTGQQMLIYGGYGGRTAEDLWSYDSNANRWWRIRPWGEAPSARGAFSAVWDPVGARMLVASAYVGGRPNDLWAYRPASNAWQRPQPVRPAPSARQQHSAVWADDAMLVFGGYRSGSEFLDDLWSYRPDTSSWVRVQPGGVGPSARSGHAAAWDPADGMMLLFGGYGVDGYRDERWAYSTRTGTRQ